VRRQPGDSLVADVRVADASLFRTLRIPLLAGATFSARDVLDAPPRILINETMARALWPRGAIGKRARIPMYGGITPEVIGVVGDVHLMDARTPPRATVYLAATRFPSETWDVIVRANVDPNALVNSLRAAVSALDPTIPTSLVTTLDGLVARTLARDRFTAVLLAHSRWCHCSWQLSGSTACSRAMWRSVARRSASAWRWAHRPRASSRSSCGERCSGRCSASR
jgi:hypothetical protein